jgi:penicillin-binding protein 2
MTRGLVQQRLFLFQLVVVLAFAVLAVKLWSIQLGDNTDYRRLAAENSLRLQTVDAPRGVIYDREGRILVRNRPSFRATLIPAQVVDGPWQLWPEEKWQLAVTRLRAITYALGKPFPRGDVVADLREALRSATGRMLSEDIDKLCQADEIIQCYSEALVTAPYRPVLIEENLPTELAFMTMENHVGLPGLSVESTSQREYLYGPLFSHLIGYEHPITQDILNRQTRFTTNPYESDDRVGMSGLEWGYEDELRGVKGDRLIEENVIGQRVRLLSENPPRPGHNLFMTIDTELQQVVTDALQEGLNGVGSEEGVAIVMNPNTGEILAMVSLPTYDNNEFVGAIDPEVYRQFNEDPLKPLFNRAISGMYPPGSIFKIIPAAGALADGIITRDTALDDPGVIKLPREDIPDNPELAMELAQEFVCWLERGHEQENVVDAIAHSCDVFFYKVGGGWKPDQFGGLGIDALAKWARAFGLGQPTRIRLPGEAVGHVPDQQWKRLVKQERWTTGDTYNMSIGQGDVLVTPLQILNATTAVANQGTIYEPQLIYQIQDAEGNVVQSFEPRELRHVSVAPEHLAVVAEGMRGAAAWDDGTARLVFEGSPVHVAGKTGTAEYCPSYQREDGTWDCKLDEDGNQLTHAWFSAFAPYEKPEIALVVFVNGNEEYIIQGSEIAAPIARKIIDYYFTREQRPTAPPAEPVPTQVVEETPASISSGQYIGTLQGSEPQEAAVSSVAGQVLNRDGTPMVDVTVTLSRGGVPIETVNTGPDGTFQFETLDPNEAPTWYVRVPNLPGSPSVTIPVAPQQRYRLLFQEAP